MTVVNLRRVPRDATKAQIVDGINQVIDLAGGNRGGRIRLRGDDGTALNIAGGASLSTNNYALDVQSTIDNIAAFVLKGTSSTAAPTTANSAVLIQESGLFVGQGKALRIYEAGGVDYAALTSTDGGLAVGGSGANVGILTGLTSLSLSSFLSVGATPATTGFIRLANTNTVKWRNAANSADISGLAVNGADNMLLGDQTNVANLYALALTSVLTQVGSNIVYQATTSGAVVGYSGGNLGFFGAAGTTKGTFTQTYSTADPTLNAYASDPESGVYTGLATGLGGAPYASVTNLESLRVAYENLRGLTEDLAQFVNAIVDKWQAHGAFA